MIPEKFVIMVKYFKSIAVEDRYGNKPPQIDGTGENTIPLRSFIGSIYIPTFLIMVGYGMILPVIPLYARELGASLGLSGLVLSMRGIGNLVFDLPAGSLVSHIGEKKTMLAASACAFLIAAATGFSSSILILALLTMALGGVHALWLLSIMSYLRRAIPQNRRGRGLSLVGGVFRTAVFLGPIAGGLIAREFGLRFSYFAQALVTSAAFLLVLFSGQPLPPPVATRDLKPKLQRLGHTLVAHRLNFLTTGSVVIVLQLLRSGRRILFPLWGSFIGLDVAAIGLILGLSAAADLILFYPAGFIMDRWGRKWAAIPCLTLLSLSLLLVPLAQEFKALLLIALLTGLGNGLGSGLVMILGTDLAPDDSIGEFLGLWRLIGDLGTASGPLLIGLIAQAASLSLAPLIPGVLGFAAACFMALRVRETLKKEKGTNHLYDL